MGLQSSAGSEVLTPSTAHVGTAALASLPRVFMGLQSSAGGEVLTPSTADVRTAALASLPPSIHGPAVQRRR